MAMLALPPGTHKEKVFKLRVIKIRPDEKIQIVKKHCLKNTSGRIHYSRIHYLQLQINGKRYAKSDFRINT